MDPGPLGMNGSVVAPYAFDHLAPDYVSVLAWRARFLHRIRVNGNIAGLKAFYREHPGQFILDWGLTFEPRNPEIGLPSKIPFVFFPRQVDWLDWALERWRARERGITVKSRGSGVSWLAVSLACALCLFREGLSIGFGSRKEELVDKLGDPKSLFYKARMFLRGLPPEFRCGWVEERDSRQMRILFPETGSAMTGEGGDQIGRGDRTSMYFVDEAAFLEHPETAEGSLSDTTNCRIDVSTAPQLPTSPFWDRVDALPPHQVFTFSWRDDPRRSKAWEEKARRELSPIVFAREFDMSRDEGGAFFHEESLLVKGDDGVFRPVETPQLVDAVFATVDTAVKSGKTHDGLAVVYSAVSPSRSYSHKLVTLDWDILKLDGALLIEWLPSVFKRLEELARFTRARMGSVGAWIEDKAAGSILLQQASGKWPVNAIESKLTAMGKTERGFDVSGKVYAGDVKISRHAYEKVVEYEGASRNHLLSQVLAFRPGAPEGAADDLYDAWAYAIAIGIGNAEGF